MGAVRLRVGHARRELPAARCWPSPCCAHKASVPAPSPLERGWKPPDWTRDQSLSALGSEFLPDCAYLVEVTSFTLMAVFSLLRLGTTASASHQIAASVATVLYMMPLSMAIACPARGFRYWLGAGQADARLRGVVALALKTRRWAYAAMSWRPWPLFWLATCCQVWYSPIHPKCKAAASALLVWVAFYHLADAAQAVCAFHASLLPHHFRATGALQCRPLGAGSYLAATS